MLSSAKQAKNIIGEVSVNRRKSIKCIKCIKYQVTVGSKVATSLECIKVEEQLSKQGNQSNEGFLRKQRSSRKAKRLTKSSLGTKSLWRRLALHTLSLFSNVSLSGIRSKKNILHWVAEGKLIAVLILGIGAIVKELPHSPQIKSWAISKWSYLARSRPYGSIWEVATLIKKSKVSLFTAST